MKSVPIKLNLSEAKAHLGKYANLAKKGKEFLICERNQPIARLQCIENDFQRNKPVKLGLALGQIQYSGDWNEVDLDIQDLFYGK